MKAISYRSAGDSSVLELVDRDPREPGDGEVRVRVAVSGVNPTDWKSRSSGSVTEPKVPNQDGAGTIDAVGPGVDGLHAGDRVWLWDVAYGTAEGTAQQLVTLPADHVVRLPDGESFDTGASLGIPALTAHLALTANEQGPARLMPGAHHTIDYRAEDVPAAVKAIAPDGVDTIVDVALVANIADDVAVIAVNGTIAAYTDDGGAEVTIPVRPMMGKNTRFQFVLTYTASAEAKAAAVAGVSDALAAGALRVGEEHGLPLTRFALADTGAAHDAVEQGAVGKVLIDVG